MPSPILARADALMQRRLHGQAVSDDVPTLTEAIGDDGIPLLLNVEAPVPQLAAAIEAEPEASPVADFSPAIPLPVADTAPVADTLPAANLLPAAGIDRDEREWLIRELACRVEQRLISELPQIIAATVRDVLAEQDITDPTLPPA
ncbi:MAG: hypothetical protein ACM3X0_07885 [Bacteroidota bacterium]